MPKMIVSIDGVVIKEVQLTKDRTTLGRRPYNDIVIDNLAVSGEHAVLQMVGSQVYLEDLNSTNGTYVNGKAVKKQLLDNGDNVEVGKYSIRFVSDSADPAFDKAAAMKTGDTPSSPMDRTKFATIPGGLYTAQKAAAIRVLSGVASGREVPLIKEVTTLGKPGVAIAAITRRQLNFVIHHVEGAGNTAVNGAPVGADTVALKNGDLIELAGIQMQFIET